MDDKHYQFKQQKLHVEIKKDDDRVKKVELKQYILDKFEHDEATNFQKQSENRVRIDEIFAQLEKIKENIDHQKN